MTKPMRLEPTTDEFLRRIDSAPWNQKGKEDSFTDYCQNVDDWRIKTQTAGEGVWYVLLDDHEYPRATGSRDLCMTVWDRARDLALINGSNK